jgi:hypothetical protein
MKLKNVTTVFHICAGGACPALYETDRDSFLVVGKKVSFPGAGLEGKVGPEEAVVEVPAGLIRGLIQSSELAPKHRDEGDQGDNKLP